MRPTPVLLLLALLPTACARAAPARTPATDAAMHAQRWPLAESLAAASADPVAATLVDYTRMLTPGAARADEIAGFLDANPDWPNRQLMARRLSDALPTEGDDAIALRLCATRAIDTLPGQLRCANAARLPGADPAELAATTAGARRAWVAGLDDAAQEVAFLAVWGPALTPADQQARFDRLAWTDTAGAARQALRLPPAMRPPAQARLALRTDDLGALALLAALPEPARSDPALMLEQARSLRRQGQDGAALALWRDRGAAAERDAPDDRRPAFWSERELLARRLLHSGDPEAAYALADGAAQTAPGPRAEAQFLAGWIALRPLHDPVRAEPHFRAVADGSQAALTRSRGLYWLARAEAAHGEAEPARRDWQAAAALPTTFYGQLAALAAGEDQAALQARLRAAHDPAWSPDQALAFAGGELARAATRLVAWNEPRRAQAFLLALDDRAPDPTSRALAARLALSLGLPQDAVAAARLAGRDGQALPDSGWPVAVAPPPGVPPAITLGLVRQESSFDAEAASPAGARGLMQLMPATARAQAQRLGQPVSLPALTADPAYNLRLGTAFLAGLLTRYGGVLPYAAAAYNAGPGRVDEWLATNGDPATAPAADGAMLDWIELIPFAETRNYVQRVIENVVVYQARLPAAPGEVPRHPLVGWPG